MRTFICFTTLALLMTYSKPITDGPFIIVLFVLLALALAQDINELLK